MSEKWTLIKLVANYIAKNPGMTGAEISQAVGNPGAYRRLSELQRHGLAQKGKLKHCTVSDRLAWTWHPCDKSPEPDRGQLRPRDEIKRLKARVEHLENILDAITSSKGDGYIYAPAVDFRRKAAQAMCKCLFDEDDPHKVMEALLRAKGAGQN